MATIDNSDVKEKAEFNMAVSYLNRLNALLYAADEAAISLNVYQWFHVLTSLYRELSTEMTPEQIHEFDKDIGIMNQVVVKVMQDGRRSGRISIEHDQYMIFHKFELKLRGILKSSGLQMKVTTDASRALFES